MLNFLSITLFVSICLESNALSWSLNTKSIRKIITHSSFVLLFQPILPLSVPQIQTIAWADSSSTSSSSASATKIGVTSLDIKDLDPEAIDTYRKAIQNEKEGELKVQCGLISSYLIYIYTCMHFPVNCHDILLLIRAYCIIVYHFSPITFYHYLCML